MIRQVGFPDPETFDATYASAGAWLDDLLAEHGIPHDRTILGGFSQGAVMTYALGLGADRPRPAGLIAPERLHPDRRGLRAGRRRPACRSRSATAPTTRSSPSSSAATRATGSSSAGADVTYRESPMPHTIDPAYLDELRGWVSARAETAA